MMEFVLPVEIVLNPPDIVMSDLYMPNTKMVFATYKVMNVQFGANNVRFLGLNSEEDRTTEIKSTYLLWNRSFYYAEMFVKPVGVSDVWYVIEPEIIPNIITSVLVPLVAHLEPITCNRIMIVDFSSVIKGYDGLNTITNECVPTAQYIEDTEYKNLYNTFSLMNISVYTASFLMVADFKPKNINLGVYVLRNMGGTVFEISLTADNNLLNVKGDIQKCGEIIIIDTLLVNIGETIWKNFVKIITTEELISTIGLSVYLKQPITIENKG